MLTGFVRQLNITFPKCVMTLHQSTALLMP